MEDMELQELLEKVFERVTLEDFLYNLSEVIRVFMHDRDVLTAENVSTVADEIYSLSIDYRECKENGTLLE